MLNKSSLKNKYRRIRESKDGMVLVQNFAYLTILQVIGYIFPLITIPYLASVIGVEGYGKIAFASSVVVYFQTIVKWGFSYTAVRDIAKNKDNIELVSSIFSTVFFAKLFLSIVSTIIFAILIYTIPFFKSYEIVLWFTYFIVIGDLFFPDWFFQAMEEMKYITIMNFCSKLLFTILVFVVITEKNDYVYEPLLVTCGMVVSGLFSFIYGIKRYHVRFKIPPFKDIKNTINGSFNVFLSTFIPNMYSNFTVIMLGIFGGETATGLFSSGKKFSDLCDQFSNILSRTFFPFLARKINKHSLYVKISGSLSILMGLFLFLFSDLLIDLFYTEEFEEAALVLKIMSISPFFMFLINTYGTNYLILKGKDNMVKNIVMFSSFVGLIISCYCVINYSYIGAAITILIARMLMGVLDWMFARKIKKQNL